MGYFAYKAFLQDNDGATQDSKSSAVSQKNQEVDNKGYDGVFFDATKPLEETKQPNLQTQEMHSRCFNGYTGSKFCFTNPNPTRQTNAASRNQQLSHPEQSFFFNPKSP